MTADFDTALEYCKDQLRNAIESVEDESKSYKIANLKLVVRMLEKEVRNCGMV
jgi:hypothetical protein